MTGDTMPEIKLITIDLDHTLLDADRNISERNRRAVLAAVDAGVTVAIATGRSHESARTYAQKLEIDAPIISYNGAMIRRPGDDEPMRHVRLEADLAAEIVETLVHDMIDFLYFLDNKLYVAKFDRWARRYLARTGDHAIIAGDMRRFAGERPTKLLMVGRPEQTRERHERFSQEYGDRIYCTISLPEYMEILNPDATKATALRWLADHLGVSMEQTMALGDSLNDLEMVQAAGVGVFMPCADDDLREHADFVPEDQDGGVGEALEKLALSHAPAVSEPEDGDD
ncbi:MAG: Cof-type HAD-IIB family hydrolase [Armatimonadia bacterium]|nr:Cof-type HAD-IIB family hydrolase [Armatimonadia bacterium]